MTHDRWVREIKPVGRDRLEVICEGDAPFVLYKKELLQYGIRENAVCSSDTYEAICNEVLRPRARNRCMYLIEKQDYTETQIRQKLRSGLYPEEIIDETVEWLKSTRALDDRRYAETYIRSVRGRYSRQMLAQKLRQRGISKELTKELLSEDGGYSEYLPDEEKQIASILKKKNYDTQEASPQEREKIRQMLLRKGFSVEQIRKMT